MVGTYAAALFVIAASIPVGAAVLLLAGRREWSWIAPALGLALLSVLAWLLVRLPGEGLTCLIGLGAVAIACGALALPRLDLGKAEIVRAGVPTALITLLVVSIPFAVEGHFGILGTGFNVDMSQHLFAADWIATQRAPAPELVQQGYPVGPHSLAVATSEFSAGNLVLGFSGVTIAVPVIAALTALTGLLHLGRLRAVLAAVLVAVPYLVASYLAQGAFKELFEAAFLVAFALWLHGLRAADAASRGAALPGAVLAAGALYAYSGPGIVWLLGTLGIWAGLELLLHRTATLENLRRALPALAVALVVFVALVGPEASRIADFGGSAGNVANSSDREPRAATGLLAQSGGSDAGESPEPAGAGGAAEPGLDLFNNDLGNLFGDIPALQVFGVWPTGDFRVQPGDGATPTAAFYLGALIGIAALGVGLLGACRRRDTALLAALAATAIIWLAALLLSTPYTTAKALQMVAPVLTLVAVRGVFDPGFSPIPGSVGSPRAWLKAGLAAGFALAALGSSALALANAPVGPERYSAGISKLRERLTGQSLLALVPDGQLNERHGAAYYGWELRGSKPICVEAFPESGSFGRDGPAGIHYVLTIGGKSEPPFDNLRETSRRFRVTLWEVEDFDPAAVDRIEVSDDVPTSCELGLG